MSKPTVENYRTTIPLLGDINNRRFVTAVLAGVLGGVGTSAAANLLRQYRDLRKTRKGDETDDDTIVLTLPKAAEDGYTGMANAKPGERKITAKGGMQSRENGRYGKAITVDPDVPKDETAVKKADPSGNPGTNSVATVVANTLGLTAGGIVSYEVASRLFDAMNERRLKRKLRAAQEAYVNAMTGASKRAEAVMQVLGPVERVVCRDQTKSAGIVGGISDLFPDTVTNTLRYPTAGAILALLAGTGATAYVTKKVMDREFPEEKLKKDINKPTRIVFRTVDSKPVLLEGEKGEEKEASADTCAAITAMLPIYMDIVEGKPNRTMAGPYVKIAESAGTDPAGLLKLASESADAVHAVIMKNPAALLSILRGTEFGLNPNKGAVVDIVRREHPETYRRAVDAAIDAHFAGGPNDGLIRRMWNGLAKATTKGVAAMGGRDMLVDHALKTAATKEAGVLDSAAKAVRAGAGRYKELLTGSRLAGMRNAAVSAAESRIARSGVISDLTKKVDELGKVCKSKSDLRAAIRAVQDSLRRGDVSDIAGVNPKAELRALQQTLRDNSKAKSMLAGVTEKLRGEQAASAADAAAERAARIGIRGERGKILAARLGTAGAGVGAGGTGLYGISRLLSSDDAGSRKAAESDDFLRANYFADSILRKGNRNDGDSSDSKELNPDEITAKAKKRLKGRRSVRIEAADPVAAKYLASNKDAIRKLLSRLNAQGSI